MEPAPPAEQRGVPVSFSRLDSEGRTVVYQPELDVEAPAGGEGDAHFWSFSAPGCYAIQADGDRFTNLTVIAVGEANPSSLLRRCAAAAPNPGIGRRTWFFFWPILWSLRLRCLVGP